MLSMMLLNLNMLMNRLILILTLGLLFAHQAASQDVPAWDQLSLEQQQILQPYKQNWGSLSSDRESSLQRGEDRWSKMSNEQRQQTKNNMKN